MNPSSVALRAYRHLVDAREPSRGWSDFDLAPGESDHWVSAYIACALLSSGQRDASDIAHEVWIWLIEQRRSDRGWGYNATTPHDADSTSWALSLARELGCGHWPPARQASRFLDRCARPDGGVATYEDDVEIRAFIAAPDAVSFRGWCGSHVCVSAASAKFHAPDTLLSYLARAQQADGRWKSYWWCEDVYATALAAEALVDHAPEAIDRAVRWGLERVGDDGSVTSELAPVGGAFACAMMIRLLLLRSREERVRGALERSVSWLCTAIREDGSWEGSAGLRVPEPDMLDPSTRGEWELGHKIQGALVRDQRGLFTTATALAALGAWQTQHDEGDLR